MLWLAVTGTFSYRYYIGTAIHTTHFNHAVVGWNLPYPTASELHRIHDTRSHNEWLPLEYGSSNKCMENAIEADNFSSFVIVFHLSYDSDKTAYVHGYRLNDTIVITMIIKVTVCFHQENLTIMLRLTD